jgi:hypothetical protein
LVPSTETRLVFDTAQAGLIAGTVPTNAQMRHHEGGSSVAGDHDEIGRMLLDQIADQRHHAGDDGLLAVMAVGEERVVGDIDEVRVVSRRHDLAQHGEAAEAGIEDENRGTVWHGVSFYPNK